VVPPENPAALAAAIRELMGSRERLGELGARALAAAPRFSRQQHAERMIEVLERVVRSTA
jgi:glycosyltransferase involved in cell wall biosynthesis